MRHALSATDRYKTTLHSALEHDLDRALTIYIRLSIFRAPGLFAQFDNPETTNPLLPSCITHSTSRPAIMTRMTRARAAEVAETLHVDEDAVLGIPDEKISSLKPATPPRERSRSPLGELAPNSAESKESEHPAEKQTRGRKGGKKTAKGKKKDMSASTASQPEEEAAQDEGTQAEGGVELAESQGGGEAEPADATARTCDSEFGSMAGALTHRLEDMSQTPLQGETPEQQDGKEERNETEPEKTISPKRSPHNLPNISVHEDTTANEDADKLEEPPTSPIATATPRVINSLRKDIPGKRSTSNKENVQPLESTAPATPSSTMRIEQPPSAPSYDELEAAVVHAATPPPAVRRESSMRAEHQDEVAATATAVQAATPSSSSRRPSSTKAGDAIEALDDLEDAVENVKQAIPQVLPLAETRRASRIASEKDKPAKTKSAPVVKMTKAAQARLSMAQGVKNDAGARPRPSTTLGRTGSVRQSTVPTTALGRSSSVRQSVAPTAGKRVTSTSSNKATKDEKDEPREKKEAAIPHSKSRPISMSFPTPPPPPKSTKAPTKSSFQLPGEAVAAKLKAAREARAAAEAKVEEKKPAFKARPAPSMSKKTPSVRQTTASRARESTMNGNVAPKPTPTSSSTTGLKRSNTVATSKPRPSTSTNTTSARTNALAVPRARPSTSGAIASGPNAFQQTTASNASGRSVSASNGTTKGKEVFNRAAAAKAAAEQEKKDKEEAAKRARAEAAERSRQISREWAEKQKAKKAKAEVAGPKGEAVAG